MAAKKSSKGIGLNYPAVACAPHRPTREQVDRERRWQAESDLRTLQQAEEIRSDRGRMSYAKRVAAEQVRALSKVSGRKR